MEESNKVIVFRTGNEEYAISIRYVISIEKIEGVTPIPHLPEYVKGIVKIRGELIPILDMERILYNRSIEEEDTSRIVVIRTEDLTLGILVNEAKDIIDIPSRQIKQLGLVAYHRTSYFTGVANLDSRLITIIDPTKLIPSLEGIREIQDYMKNKVNE